MQLAQEAIKGSYLVAGLHMKPGGRPDSIGFHTRLESRPFTDLITSAGVNACVIAQLKLLQHAASVCSAGRQTPEGPNELLAEAREINEASARPANPEPTTTEAEGS